MTNVAFLFQKQRICKGESQLARQDTPPSYNNPHKGNELHLALRHSFVSKKTRAARLPEHFLQSFANRGTGSGACLRIVFLDQEGKNRTGPSCGTAVACRLRRECAGQPRTLRREVEKATCRERPPRRRGSSRRGLGGAPHAWIVFFGSECLPRRHGPTPQEIMAGGEGGAPPPQGARKKRFPKRAANATVFP